MKIHESLVEIQNKLTVSKSKYNDFGNFNYRSCEDILKAVKPFLKEYGLVLLLTDEVISIGEKIYVKAIARLSDGIDTLEVSALAREPEKPKAKMDESQMTGSTSSYARKYALNGLFGLDDGVDSDATNNGKEPKKDAKTDKETKPATKTQIEELKKLGFDDERLKKMAAYYKVDDISKITYKQADEAIKKQKRALEKQKAGGGNE